MGAGLGLIKALPESLRDASVTWKLQKDCWFHCDYDQPITKYMETKKKKKKSKYKDPLINKNNKSARYLLWSLYSYEIQFML